MYTDIKKFSVSKEKISQIKKIIWSSIDDVAQKIYEDATDKESVNMRYHPIMYSYFRKALTIGIILGASTMFYLSGCNEEKHEQEYKNSLKSNYTLNSSTQEK